MTNADKIRAMTDEELAELFAKCHIGCPVMPTNCADSCRACWLKWLMKEAEE